jgi:hypothetical protein
MTDIQDFIKFSSERKLIRGKNLLINGNFDVWQRGTADFVNPADAVTADQWRVQRVGSTVTVSQQSFAMGQTDVPNNPSHFLRMVVTAGAGVNDVVQLKNRIEGVATFSGETVTLTFWAKANAPKNMAVEFAQSFGTGGSSDVFSIGVTTVALTTAWTQYTITVAIPSVLGKTIGTDGSDYLQVCFFPDAGASYNARTNSLGHQSGTFDIAQVQVERGVVASHFEVTMYTEELMRCQRYFERIRLLVQKQTRRPRLVVEWCTRTGLLEKERRRRTRFMP